MVYSVEKYKFIAHKDDIFDVDTPVDIEIDLEYGCSFWFTKNENIVEYELKGYFQNFRTKTLIIEWIKTEEDKEKNIIANSSETHAEINSEYYVFFNTYASYPLFHVKQCINKIMQREIGYICFGNSGEFLLTS